MAKLTYQQKLDALAYRFYQAGSWEPKAGDFYTTSRADLELYQVVSVEDGVVRTRYTEGSDAISEWPEGEFLAAGFGPKRVLVPEWIICAKPVERYNVVADDENGHSHILCVDWMTREAAEKVAAHYRHTYVGKTYPNGKGHYSVNNVRLIAEDSRPPANLPEPPMTELSITRPSTIEQFLATLSAHGVKLPLDTTDDDVGTLVDADGRTVLVVDVERERSDEDVAWIVGMIQVAVNTCGGFKATRVSSGGDHG